MDFWFAECLPCKWEIKIPYADQPGEEDRAIAAVEEHVAATHQRVPGLERARQYIGHVQLRTETALAPVTPPPPPDVPPPEG